MDAIRCETIYWKANYVEGIRMVDDVIMDWPATLGAIPTEAQIQGWIVEYQAWKVTDDATKADAANVEVLIEDRTRQQAIASLQTDGLLTAEVALTDAAKTQISSTKLKA